MSNDCKCCGLEKERDELKVELDSAKSEIRRLEDEITRARKMLWRSRVEYDARYTELLAANEEIRKLKLQNSNMDSDMYDTNSYVVGLIGKLRNINQYADHLEDGLRQSSSEYDNLLNRYRRWAFGGPERPL